MKMKNRHLVNMLPTFGTSPSGDFQFSIVGSVTHQVQGQIISCLGLFSSALLSKVKFLGQRLTFSQPLSIDCQKVNRRITANENSPSGLGRTHFPSLGLKMFLVSFWCDSSFSYPFAEWLASQILVFLICKVGYPSSACLGHGIHGAQPYFSCTLSLSLGSLPPSYSPPVC